MTFQQQTSLTSASPVFEGQWRCSAESSDGHIAGRAAHRMSTKTHQKVLLKDKRIKGRENKSKLEK